MDGLPSPTSPTKFTFDSFDLEGGSVIAKSGEGDPTPPAAASASPSPTPQDGEAERLVQEVTRLYRERYRLARMHRKAELRVLASLRRRRQGDDGSDDMEDDDEGGHVDWSGQATKAREALLEADRTVSAKELHYRLLLEKDRTNAANTANQATTTLERLIEQERQLVKQSFSSLPPEKDRKQTVENLLKRQQQVEEQLKQARTTYFSLVLKKQCQEEELQRRRDAAEDQVSVAEMLRLVVETEAFTEEAAAQESRILTYKASLKNMASVINKHTQQKKDLAERIKKEEKKVDQLKLQLSEEKQKLKKLSKKQEISKKKSASLQPSSRLLLDPVLAKDLKEKLALKVSLEDEVCRLKQICRKETKTLHRATCSK
ncbi:uncharacterized protein [Panulirus ornatus]